MTTGPDRQTNYRMPIVYKSIMRDDNTHTLMENKWIALAPV